MKSQRAWMMTLATIGALLAHVSTANAQFPRMHPTPGFNPAAGPSAVMMGQEYYDPTFVGATDYGNAGFGPSWYDISVDAVYMKRDDAGRTVPVTSDGIAGVGPPNVVMSTDDLDFDYEPGVQASIRYQLSAAYNIEAGYLGVVDWGARASATSDHHSLYSVFSQFGNEPFGGFADVDQATLQSLRYRSDLDSVEINLRRTWISFQHQRLHGSWLVGFRWAKLQDRMRFFSDVQPHFDDINQVDRDAAQTDYLVNADNNLYGGQIGAQLGVGLIRGLIVSGQIKAGGYAVQSDVDSVLDTTSLTNPVVAAGDSDDFALLAEGGAYVTYQLHPMWKIRAGYQFVYFDGVALASENLGTPAIAGGISSVFVNDNGSVLLHGGVLGLEFGW